jgi:hypothetical protein
MTEKQKQADQVFDVLVVKLGALEHQIQCQILGQQQLLDRLMAVEKQAAEDRAILRALEERCRISKP